MDNTFFRVEFKGDTTGFLGAKTISPEIEKPISFAAKNRDQALVVGKGAHLRYDLGSDFPCEAGCLEVRLRPNFPQTSEQPGRTVLKLRGKGPCSVSLSFVQIGYAWEFMVKASRKTRSLRAWYGMAKQGRWNHFLLVWDRNARPSPALAFYVNGKRAYGSMFASYDFVLRNLTELEIGGQSDAEVEVGEVVIYNHALTESQARFLSASFGKKGDRFSALAEKMAEDEHKENNRAIRRHRQVAQLEGKVGSLLQLRGHKPQEVRLPEGITAVAVRPEDITKIDLNRFSAIYFPPGGGYQLTEEEKKGIVRYVENGGGYVGSCMGAFTAHNLGLLDFECHKFYEQGLTQIILDKHPVTGGCGKKVYMHHGNGPIMVPRKGCEAVGVYNMGDPNQKSGAILVGMHGKGRVVLFGPHPTGGSVSQAGKSVRFTGEDLGTNRMLVNALLYAAKITGKNKKR